jgi:ferrochelatase
MKKKVAVILFNLGGPDNQEAVRPFLFNLFNDRAIIGLPHPFRFLIAKLISSRRAPIARQIYAQMNGGSPILKNTQDQANALEKILNEESPEGEYRVFIAMRYWHPFADDTVKAVKAYAPDNVFLLPLYPQFSTTTSASSLKDWEAAAVGQAFRAETKMACCYPQEEGFIDALCEVTKQAYAKARTFGKPRILFSAHGLPEKIIKNGDPYQYQCKLTVDALRKKLAIDDLDSVLCFQSRVGPMKWISPATDDEVRRAGRDKVPVVVVPVAFVSDHSETLVELNIEYRHVAETHGVPHYGVVPTVGAAQAFIGGLKKIVLAGVSQGGLCEAWGGKRICPSSFKGCGFRDRSAAR